MTTVMSAPKQQDIVLRRINKATEPCVAVRFEVPRELTWEVQRLFQEQIKYAVGVTLKDAYVYLVRVAIQFEEENPDIAAFQEDAETVKSTSGVFLYMPEADSEKLDAYRAKLNLSKPAIFLAFLKKGIKIFKGEIAR